MTTHRRDPLREHARLPPDHRIFRGPFLAGTIPQPSDEDRAHDHNVERLVQVIKAQERAARERRAAQRAARQTGKTSGRRSRRGAAA